MVNHPAAVIPCNHGLFLVELAITIPVGLVNHRLEFLVRHSLAKLLGNTLQVLERDLARVVVVVELESLGNTLQGAKASLICRCWSG